MGISSKQPNGETFVVLYVSDLVHGVLSSASYESSQGRARAVSSNGAATICPPPCPPPAPAAGTLGAMAGAGMEATRAAMISTSAINRLGMRPIRRSFCYSLSLVRV
jgi:hypothetical protein